MAHEEKHYYCKPVIIFLGVLCLLLLLIEFWLYSMVQNQRKSFDERSLEYKKQIEKLEHQLFMQKKSENLSQVSYNNKLVVVVAKMNIKAGSVIKPDDLEFKEIKTNQAHEGSSSTTTIFIGRKSISDIKAGEQVLSKNLEN